MEAFVELGIVEIEAMEKLGFQGNRMKPKNKNKITKKSKKGKI